MRPCVRRWCTRQGANESSALQRRLGPLRPVEIDRAAASTGTTRRALGWRTAKHYVTNFCIVRAPHQRIVRLALQVFAVPLEFLESSKQFIRLNRREG